MDIGGTHFTVALHEGATGRPIGGTLLRRGIHAAGDAESILSTWAQALSQVMASSGGRPLAGIGIAMPGPFDYDHGISLLKGLAKYDAIHGMNVRRELKSRLGLPDNCPILFRNDAACFLLGEIRAGSAHDFHRAIGITLGTGFGSAFAAEGELVESGQSLPASGWLYDCPFRGRTAEDWFSGRGLLEMVHARSPHRYQGVGDYALAVRAGAYSDEAFRQYGSLMGEFLRPWIERFQADGLVVGGNISRSLDLFGAPLRGALPDKLTIRASVLLEEAALIGAASLPLHLREPD
jgi:glucokinase